MGEAGKNNRQTIRMKDYDYSQPGTYFVTICSNERKNFFGKIVDEKMVLNSLGKIVETEWFELKEYFFNIDLDEFIIMPNHVHGIVVLYDPVTTDGAGARPAPTSQSVGVPLAGTHDSNMIMDGAGARPAPTLGVIVGAFKSLCFNYWRQYVKNNNLNCPIKFWQRNYYEQSYAQKNL